MSLEKRSCADLQQWLLSYVDGEISPQECTEVEQHLQQCTRCQLELGAQRALQQLIARSCRCAPAPVEVRERMLLRLAQVRQVITPDAVVTTYTEVVRSFPAPEERGENNSSAE